MANRLIKQAAVKYVVGTPGVPGTPDRYEIVRTYDFYGPDVASITAKALQIYSRATFSNYFLDIRSNNIRTRQAAGEYMSTIIRAIGGGTLASSVDVQETITVVRIPGSRGTPATPPQATLDQQRGWNAGARSIGLLPGDGWADFQVAPLAVGVVVGLSSTANTPLPNEQSHAFYAHGGVLEILEAGATVATLAVDLATRPTLRLSRVSGQVRYWVNGEVVHVSAVPSEGAVLVDASLYVAGDYVDNPELVNVVSASARGVSGVDLRHSRRPRARGAVGITGVANPLSGNERRGKVRALVGVVGSAIPGAVRALTARGLTGPRASASAGQDVGLLVAPRFAVMGGSLPYAEGRVAWGAYAAEGEMGFPRAETGGGVVVVPPFFAYGTMLVAETGSGALEYAGYGTNGADAPHAEGFCAWGGYASAGWPLVGDTADVDWLDALVMQDWITGSADLTANLVCQLRLTDGITAVVQLDGDLIEVLLVGTTAALVAELDAVLTDGLAIGTASEASRVAAFQLVVNAVTNAFATYQGFDFIGLETTPLGSFAVRADGVYRIGEAGDPIDAAVDFGATHFGLGTLKRIDAVYIGGRVDGQVFLKLDADGAPPRIYRVHQRQPLMRTSPARGATAWQWGTQLQLQACTAAEVMDIQFVPVDTGRRWGG